MKLLNFGSLNLDVTYLVNHFVRPGETEASISRMTTCGGKGLNQSIALSKCGCRVYHAGALGASDGAPLLQALKDAGVNTDYVIQREDVPSGSAFIQVNTEGENCIVLDGGANQCVSKEYVDNVLSHFAKGDWLILQNEISNIPYIIERAHEIGMIIVLNPSPMNDSVLDMPLGYIDYFLLNEEEAAALSDHADDPISELQKRYPDAAIIVTLGSEGSVCVKNGTRTEQPAFPVTAVDTVGAGDTYTGFLIGSLVQGREIDYAMRLASKASAISVTRKGASTSIPELGEVLASLS